MNILMDDLIKLPWHRISNEPDLWYNRFVQFLLLPNRSFLLTYKLDRDARGLSRLNSLPRSWRVATKKYFWKERAGAWDESNRNQDLADWESRHQSLREKQWELSQKILVKAEDMLEYPLATVTSEDGATVINPTKWSLRDAAGLIETASNLASSALPPTRDDAIEALQVLVRAGWIPKEVLLTAQNKLTETKAAIHDSLLNQ